MAYRQFFFFLSYSILSILLSLWWLECESNCAQPVNFLVFEIIEMVPVV